MVQFKQLEIKLKAKKDVNTLKLTKWSNETFPSWHVYDRHNGKITFRGYVWVKFPAFAEENSWETEIIWCDWLAEIVNISAEKNLE